MLLHRVAAVAALSLGFASPTLAQPAAVTINVTSFAFAPKPIHLAAGKQVTLTFVNSSGSSHDFTAKEFFAASRIVSGSAAKGEIEFKPHETKSVTLVPAAGTYHAHCSHFLHASMGMVDTIVVN